ncbi:MAG: phosphatidate cytidylyltransferase [Ardenticatenaceae bacterium]|nr:phosphatidate cytidylyltransferase [Ardenticatenaceae bacterium]MCB9444817.1 phosphatidate cytidylyltransferase [Ardenticatenaceae bacterium]
MFLQRALITFTIGPLVLYLIYLGGWFYFIPVTAILLLATYEYVHLLRLHNWNLSLWIVGTAVLLLLVISQWFNQLYLAPALLIGSLAAMAYTLVLYERRQSQTSLADWMAMMSGILLVGWLGGHFFLLRRVETTPWQWTMLAMLSTWIADSGAYVVGKFLAGKILGRHKLSPRLSPNKTVEGYVGGIFFGVLLTLAIAKYLSLPLHLALFIALFASVLSPLGDLGISMIKREVGVKDSGTLFPGHGGALDRIDSLVWSVAAAYYFVTLLS